MLRRWTNKQEISWNFLLPLVDDYYIYVSKSSQIQEIISYIRTCLAQYELSFNENKIRITEGPFLYGNPWVEEIKQYIHLQPDMFLTKLIIEYNKCKDIAILKYGLKVISYHHYTKTVGLQYNPDW